MSIEERLTTLENEIISIKSDITEIKEVLQELANGVSTIDSVDIRDYIDQQIGVLQQEDYRLAGLITTNANSISELQTQISSLETNLSNTQQSIPKLTMDTKTKTLNIKNIKTEE